MLHGELLGAAGTQTPRQPFKTQALVKDELRSMKASIREHLERT